MGLTIFFVIILLPLAVLDFLAARFSFNDRRPIWGSFCVFAGLLCIFAFFMNLGVLVGWW